MIDAQVTAQPARIAGTVRDIHGTAIPDVQVTLSGQNGGGEPVTTTDSSGAFDFPDLNPGTYQLKINASGLVPWVSGNVVLAAGEQRRVPITATGIPRTTTTVHVVATLDDVAEAQVQEEEKQRVLGFLPNFYSSYIWDAVAMKPKLKFKLAFRSTVDPFAFIVAGGVAGVEQSHKTFPGYGQGAQGYAKRYGSAYADGVVGRMMGSAVFPVLLHQDPRYFYRGSGSTRSRFWYALAATVMCRGDNGQWQPNYSHVLGSFAAAGISNIYRAPGDRSASLTFRNGLIITAGAAVSNVLREFVSRKLTPNVPAQSVGKP